MYIDIPFPATLWWIQLTSALLVDSDEKIDPGDLSLLFMQNRREEQQDRLFCFEVSTLLLQSSFATHIFFFPLEEEGFVWGDRNFRLHFLVKLLKQANKRALVFRNLSFQSNLSRRRESPRSSSDSFYHFLNAVNSMSFRDRDLSQEFLAITCHYQDGNVGKFCFHSCSSQPVRFRHITLSSTMKWRQPLEIWQFYPFGPISKVLPRD